MGRQCTCPGKSNLLMSGRTLIRGVNWVGDAVMTMPAIRAIKRARPDDTCTLLVKPWVAALFDSDPSVDEVLHYAEEHEGFMGKFRLASMLRQHQFNSAILLQNAIDAAIPPFLARIPERIGYSRDGRGLLLTHALPHRGEDRDLHHIDYYLKLLDSAGIPPAGRDTWIYMDIQERLDARAKLATLKRPIVGINPGASFGSAKMWLPKRFSQVARRVVEDLGGSAVIFGGPAEVEIAASIAEPLAEHTKAGRTLDLAGKTSLRELMRLMSECDAIVSNDSGPMHIADALGVPLAAIFGSTSWQLTGPRKPSSHVITAGLACSPCFRRVCPESKDGDLKCMEAIEVDEVFDALRNMLPRKSAVLLDRDGTLCEDAHYLNSFDKLKVFDDISSLNHLQDKHLMLIGISNQSGIGRGIVDEGFVQEVHKLFMDKYGFDGFYYCPHRPEEHCSCRKPEPGMAHQARNEHGIDLRKSFMVGDKDADMLLGRAIGAQTILVTTGKQQTSKHADHIAANLEEVTRIISSTG